MSSLFEKLKVRPTPEKKQGVEIIIVNENKSNKSKDELQKGIMSRLALNMNKGPKTNVDNVENSRLQIIDKTKESLLDVNKFMRNINRKIENKTEEQKEKDREYDKRKRATTKKIQILNETSIDDDIDNLIEDSDKKASVYEPGSKTSPIISKLTKTKGPKTNINLTSKNKVSTAEVGEKIKKRLPKSEDIVIMKKDSYYMNNREKFINFINSMFDKDYRSDILSKDQDISCDNSDNKDFSLLTHQKIVRDYLNMYTPYRGLLLYHGLGSGKTCSSIAISEGFMNLSSIAFSEGLMAPKKVIVMTPASLKKNYIEELKKCGNQIYHFNQYWEYINIRSEPDLIDSLSSALQLPINYIEKKGGAWLVNVEKESNYSTLNEDEKKSINDQIELMIDNKYSFIKYNGLRKKKLNELTNNGKKNIFSNKVIIIDEAHNFVSRIVNKIDKEKKKTDKSTSMILYEQLMSATNVRIVLLSGTPMVNYPNELGILFNILRGYIKVWEIPFETLDNKKIVNTNYMRNIFKSFKSSDYIEVTSNVLYITKNPFSFANRYYEDDYKGVRLDNTITDDSDDKFLENVIKILNKNKIKIISNKIRLELTKALPDSLDEFQDLFIDNTSGNIKSEYVFKRRILGLT